MRLLHFRRTFVEKMFAIHAKVEAFRKAGREIGGYARHYYDLFCLDERPEVLAMLGERQLLGWVSRGRAIRLCPESIPEFGAADVERSQPADRRRRRTRLRFTAPPGLTSRAGIRRAPYRGCRRANRRMARAPASSS
jgi:hypothetical protein